MSIYDRATGRIRLYVPQQVIWEGTPPHPYVELTVPYDAATGDGKAISRLTLEELHDLRHMIERALDGAARAKVEYDRSRR